MSERAVCGLDLGITNTDAVAPWQPDAAVSVPTRSSANPAEDAVRRLLEGRRESSRDVVVAATGVGVARLGERIVGCPVVPVDEHRAIGIGGARLAELDEALVVSVGTGTALVSVRGRDVQAVFPGTGIGGGTVVGLARSLVGSDDVAALADLAVRGDRSRVDFTIGEVVGGPLGALPASATASHLAKAGRESSPADLAASIVNLIAEVAVTVALLGLRATEHRIAVLVGRILTCEPVSRRIEEVSAALGGTLRVAPRAATATAWGASWSVVEDMRKGCS